MKSLTKSLKDIGFLTIALTLALAANFAYGQWSNPPAAAPGGNIQAPVNVGSSNQIKSGDITAWRQKAGAQMWSPQYCDQNGQNCFTSASVGSTGSAPSNCSSKNVRVGRGNDTLPARKHLEMADAYSQTYRRGDPYDETFAIYQCRDGSWSEIVTLYGTVARNAENGR